MALTAVVVKLSSPGPVFYRQERMGMDGRTFRILKFRTMRTDAESSGARMATAGDDRRTPVGAFLRRTSLDELPQLFNVLRGDMSLVGPRPLVMRYLPHFSAHEWKRFDMLPGITGWAQVNGRNRLAWDDRLACDAWYADHCSLALDLKILCITVVKVLPRENIQAHPGLTCLSLDEERRGRASQGTPLARAPAG